MIPVEDLDIAFEKYLFNNIDYIWGVIVLETTKNLLPGFKAIEFSGLGNLRNEALDFGRAGNLLTQTEESWRDCRFRCVFCKWILLSEFDKKTATTNLMWQTVGSSKKDTWET